ncbi:hypothetical protein [Okeania sp. SIO1I7]|nr:hypothetical protein [Okeania sp. SIO1I7]NET25122.1 hypothetical protein [Okeania sp. SIO1I7]
MIGDFSLKRYGWKDLVGKKQIFLEAFHHENISAIALGKIPEYFDCLLV